MCEIGVKMQLLIVYITFGFKHGETSHVSDALDDCAEQMREIKN